MSKREGERRFDLGRLVMDTRPLRIPAYRRLWSSSVVTQFGSQLTIVAVPKQLYDITGTSAYVGLSGLVALVPLAVFGLWGGAVADVADRRSAGPGRGAQPGRRVPVHLRPQRPAALVPRRPDRDDRGHAPGALPRDGAAHVRRPGRGRAGARCPLRGDPDRRVHGDAVL